MRHVVPVNTTRCVAGDAEESASRLRTVACKRTACVKTIEYFFVCMGIACAKWQGMWRDETVWLCANTEIATAGSDSCGTGSLKDYLIIVAFYEKTTMLAVVSVLNEVSQPGCCRLSPPSVSCSCVSSAPLSSVNMASVHTFWHYILCSALLAVFHSSLIPLTDSMTMALAEKISLDYGRFHWIGSASYAILSFAFADVVRRHPAVSFPLAWTGYLTFPFTFYICPTRQRNKCWSRKIPLPHQTGLLYYSTLRSGDIYVFFCCQFYCQL